MLIRMQNILDKFNERCGTPARMWEKMNPQSHLFLCCRHCRGGYGTLTVTIQPHQQPPQAILALALLAQQIALAEVPMMRTDGSAAVWIVLTHSC